MKLKIGKMPCESCGEPVTVRKNERDTLSYRCEECDAAPYARAGTGQHASWLAKLQPNPAVSTKTDIAAKTDIEPAAPKPPAAGNIWGIE